MIRDKRSAVAVILFALVVSLGGCASVPPTGIPSGQASPDTLYHKVEKGETLWRISKMYSVPLNDLLRANNIFDSTKIEVGQLILIPRRKDAFTADQAIAFADEDFIWPVRGIIIGGFGSSFGNMVNKGINIRIDKASDVLAARSGRIVFSDNNFLSLGKTVIIDHNDGFMTVYAGNSEILAKLGDVVRRGVPIGRLYADSGSKGGVLHFEIRKNAAAQNPNFYLP